MGAKPLGRDRGHERQYFRADALFAKQGAHPGGADWRSPQFPPRQFVEQNTGGRQNFPECPIIAGRCRVQRLRAYKADGNAELRGKTARKECGIQFALEGGCILPRF